MTSGRLVLALVAVTASAGSLTAQRLDRPTYREFELVRNPPVGDSSVLELSGGVAGTQPSTADENEAAGLAQKFAFDGFAYFHTEGLGEKQTTLDAYAGTDGAILSARDGQPGQSTSRLDLTWRYFPFYREGFYSGNDWVPTGRYQGTDFGAYLGFGGAPEEGTTVEGGPYYKRYRFERNDTTSNDFTIPEAYNAYGVRTYLEQNTVTLDREYREPVSGYVLTARIEYERNDSDTPFGTSLNQSDLATQYFRGVGRLEAYVPTSSLGIVELSLEGNWSAKDDRVYNYDTSKPIGYLWADGRLGLRLRFGPFRAIPYVEGEWTKTPDESGVSSDSKLWWGGGLRTRFDFGDHVRIYADYSYLTNPNRQTVTFNEDFYGQHQFFAGIELRFGGL